ncbi:hypothetical protein HY030_00795 [Candidatus Gottesmanbacteria bacterium]|nr:hypothetical protein [Candidatus Gottesmanbacteria bacterium]
MKPNKTILLSTIFIFFVAITSGIFAAEMTPTPSSNLKIKELKEKLASRVAELNVLSQRVFKGEIKTLSDQKIIFSAGANEVTASLDDNTALSQIDSDFQKTKIQLDDLKLGQTVYIWGTFNATTNTLTAKAVVAMKLPLGLIGKIKNVDKKNFQITVSSSSKDYLVDIDQTTRTSLYNQAKGLTRSGFSKFSAGQLVYVYGFLTVTKEGKELLPAGRILILAEAPSPTPSLTPTPTKAK